MGGLVLGDRWGGLLLFGGLIPPICGPAPSLEISIWKLTSSSETELCL